MPELPQQRTVCLPKPQYQDLFREPALPAHSIEWDEDDLPDAETPPIITA
ncbi:hypothetical protein OG369_42520 [Streptomyces sp. NBC_01221]|nr:hypothetical protein [Streptomyces sp. NBC_01221]MCX4792453.1 hypothetical protein [Streptomyces sp. NBC_01221]